MTTIEKYYRVQVKNRPNIQGKVTAIVEEGIEILWDRGGVTIESPWDIEPVKGAALVEHLREKGKL